MENSHRLIVEGNRVKLNFGFANKDMLFLQHSLGKIYQTDHEMFCRCYTGETLTCKPHFCVCVWPAGHMIISHYLLNYFPGLDIDRRNCHGFTALMKAAMQGRAEVVRALMLAGKTHTVHL